MFSSLIVRVGGMPWPLTDATHYHAQLALRDKGLAIKELVVCWVLLKQIPCVRTRKKRYLASLSYFGLLELTLECHGQQLRLYEITDRKPIRLYWL